MPVRANLWRRLARRGWQKKRLSGTTSDHGLENQKPADRPTNDSMKVDGLDGEEIEEDKLHIASLEADADEEVGDPEFEEEFRDNRTGECLDPELVAKARSEEVEFMAKLQNELYCILFCWSIRVVL